MQSFAKTSTAITVSSARLRSQLICRWILRDCQHLEVAFSGLSFFYLNLSLSYLMHYHLVCHRVSQSWHDVLNLYFSWNSRQVEVQSHKMSCECAEAANWTVGAMIPKTACFCFENAQDSRLQALFIPVVLWNSCSVECKCGCPKRCPKCQASKCQK